MNDFLDHPILTVQQHILREQQKFPGSSGEFSFLLSGITLAAKMIAAQVQRAGLTDILGTHGDINVQGEVQQKLDVYANKVLLHCLRIRESVAVLASEENEQPLTVHNGSPNARYVVVFDPLDGSSNIDVAVSVGTTFCILRRDPSSDQTSDEEESLRDVLQPGTKIIAAGYVVYGSSTILVYSAGNGVHGFTLDPAIGAFVMSHENIRIPDQGKYYSVNESHSDSFPPSDKQFLQQVRQGKVGNQIYASRYVGSMVSDIHRTLLKGGVFMYPPTASHSDGKLRLVYEANPIAFLVEQAGGEALSGKIRVLDIVPESIHQRTPIVAGGKVEMEAYRACW
ncbi:Fructose-bisphosphatase class I [Planctomycetales bacterium 10988]|nr:Fructose-bisphosphatase class I [Planctomycetales bacterium 10988]